MLRFLAVLRSNRLTASFPDILASHMGVFRRIRDVGPATSVFQDVPLVVDQECREITDVGRSPG